MSDAGGLGVMVGLAFVMALLLLAMLIGEIVEILRDRFER